MLEKHILEKIFIDTFIKGADGCRLKLDEDKPSTVSKDKIILQTTWDEKFVLYLLGLILLPL